MARRCTPGPAPPARADRGRGGAERERLEQQAVYAGQAVPKRRGGRQRAVDAAEREIRPVPAGKGQAVAHDPGRDGGGEHRRDRLGRPAERPACGQADEGQEAERTEGREQGAGEEEQGCAGPCPEEREPSAGERAVENRKPE